MPKHQSNLPRNVAGCSSDDADTDDDVSVDVNADEPTPPASTSPASKASEAASLRQHDLPDDHEQEPKL